MQKISHFLQNFYQNSLSSALSRRFFHIFSHLSPSGGAFPARKGAAAGRAMEKPGRERAARPLREVLAEGGGGFIEGCAVAFGEIGRRGEAYLVGDFAHGLARGQQQMAGALEAELAYQLHRRIIGERLYFAVELRMAQSHLRGNLLYAEVGVGDMLAEYLQESGVEAIVRVDIPHGSTCSKHRSGTLGLIAAG